MSALGKLVSEEAMSLFSMGNKAQSEKSTNDSRRDENMAQDLSKSDPEDIKQKKKNPASSTGSRKKVSKTISPSLSRSFHSLIGPSYPGYPDMINGSDSMSLAAESACSRDLKTKSVDVYNE